MRQSVDDEHSPRRLRTRRPARRRVLLRCIRAERRAGLEPLTARSAHEACPDLQESGAPLKRYTAVALAAVGGLPLACHVDVSGVTLYGVLDAGILYKTSADPAGRHQTQLASGGEEPNRWGLLGSENLG